MRVVLNGRARELETDATIEALLEDIGRGPRPAGVAVAVNGEVVSKTKWGDTKLNNDDRIEAVGAARGG